MNTTFDFVPGDIIELAGECYQVLENFGEKGMVRNFPSEEESGFELPWSEADAVSRRIGHAPLPAPSPCSSGGSCPTYEIKPRQDPDPNIIARET
ncbi:hypothetical protein [Motiliproteus sp. SC1-56]|uniref:hypothetical protein n=1 Tax=Motiliproteus sp. SC1-56 TaxID=2799565 RepID=UPI001A8EC1F7|nr:hypothetical protein [Motiliproteus sp. SC1-56]